MSEAEQAKEIKLVQEVKKIERSIKQRRDVDQPLMNYWLQLFVVTPITCGIYGIILFFKRIGRIDKFIERKQEYYHALIEFTEKYANEIGKSNLIASDIKEAKQDLITAFSQKIKPINAVLSFLLSLITLGLWGIVVLYKVNKVWYDLQLVEQEFNDKLSKAWTKLNLSKYPITFVVDSSKNRSFVLYFILNFVTLGIWGIVWDYKLYTDPDNLYREFHQVEDTVMHTVRNAS